MLRGLRLAVRGQLVIVEFIELPVLLDRLEDCIQEENIRYDPDLVDELIEFLNSCR